MHQELKSNEQRLMQLLVPPPRSSVLLPKTRVQKRSNTLAADSKPNVGSIVDAWSRPPTSIAARASSCTTACFFSAGLGMMALHTKPA